MHIKLLQDINIRQKTMSVNQSIFISFDTGQPIASVQIANDDFLEIDGNVNAFYT